jgi:hypothetical protein
LSSFFGNSTKLAMKDAKKKILHRKDAKKKRRREEEDFAL